MTHPVPGRPRVSLVIPAYNEEAYLPRLLDTVEAARGRYAAGGEAVEVIVADNDSTDGTAEIGRRRGCRIARVEKRVIGAARNGGASVARGEILAFVDADFLIHPDTFNAIERVLASSGAVGGATGATMERMSPGIAGIYAVLMPLVWATGMDTGVVFCRKEDFEAVGGYDEDMLYAEDVRFLLKLRRLGKRRRQRLVRATTAKAIASTRKFDSHGDWHYFTLIARSFWWYFFSREKIDRFAREYWYHPNR